jgi:hypothetical protein
MNKEETSNDRPHSCIECGEPTSEYYCDLCSNLRINDIYSEIQKKLQKNRERAFKHGGKKI